MIKKAGEFLQRFKQISQKSDFVKEEIMKILTNLGFSGLEKKDITIKGGTVFLKVSNIKKTQIFLKKEEILSCLSKIPETKHLKQIH